jgi:hypothetical protein
MPLGETEVARVGREVEDPPADPLALTPLAETLPPAPPAPTITFSVAAKKVESNTPITPVAAPPVLTETSVVLLAPPPPPPATT